jgi:hypothetical protein
MNVTFVWKDLRDNAHARHSGSHLYSQLLGRWRSGRSQFETSPGKKMGRRYINQLKKKLGMVAHACHPSYAGSINSRIFLLI